MEISSGPDRQFSPKSDIFFRIFIHKAFGIIFFSIFIWAIINHISCLVQNCIFPDKLP